MTQVNVMFSGLLALLWLLLLGFKRTTARLHAGTRKRPATQILRRHSQASARFTRQKPAWVRQEVIKLKAHLPQAGCRHIALVFNRLHANKNTTVGKSYVNSIVKQHQYEIALARKAFRTKKPRPVPRNAIWGLDLTGKGDVHGGTNNILGIVDHGSRRALCLQAVVRKNSLTLLGHLLIAMGTYGKPRVIRTDNESCFTSRLFNAGLTALGIRHQTTELACPWQNGRIERLFGTLKQTLDKFRITSRVELQDMLDAFSLWYNAVRPHQNMGGQTPLEAWYGIDPYSQPIKALYWFEALDGELAGYYIRR